MLDRLGKGGITAGVKYGSEKKTKSRSVSACIFICTSFYSRPVFKNSDFFGRRNYEILEFCKSNWLCDIDSFYL